MPRAAEYAPFECVDLNYPAHSIAPVVRQCEQPDDSCKYAHLSWRQSTDHGKPADAGSSFWRNCEGRATLLWSLKHERLRLIESG
jgi:hypothetical protein